jgi:hypothetical protein
VGAKPRRADGAQGGDSLSLLPGGAACSVIDFKVAVDTELFINNR